MVIFALSFLNTFSPSVEFAQLVHIYVINKSKVNKIILINNKNMIVCF